MIINDASLNSLFKGYSASFKQGFDGAESNFKQVAMVVPSATRENLYAWLGQFPKVREWIGDRLVQNLAAHGYTIKNHSFENTIAVSRDDIEDDQFGVYTPMIQEMGKSAAELPDRLIFGLIKAGFISQCYDGQYFFDTDHPVIGEDGQPYSVANTDGGAGPAWFLLDTSRAMKPFIYQQRRPFEFISLDQKNDENVFFRKECIYGCDGRANAGYGFWQMAFASKQSLDPSHYASARRNMMEMKGDAGRLLGLRPKLLLVPPALEEPARKLLNNELLPDGGTNPWKGSATLLVTPWLA